MMKEVGQSSVVRLSLRGVVSVLILLLLVGFTGGVLGSYWFQPSLPPLINNSDQLVATVQEVTISPSKAAAELVADKRRSILMLGRVSGDTVQPVAIGTVVTSDGIVVVPSLPSQPSGELMAFDGEHAGIGLSLLGRDEVYGLSYYRLAEGVLTPVDLAGSDPEIGAQLLQIGRDDKTHEPLAASVTVETHHLPVDSQPVGWQRLVAVTDSAVGENDPTMGMALIEDDGSLAGLMTSRTNEAVPVSIIRESLQRLTRQERERNALDEWGLRLRYAFGFAEADRMMKFQAEVINVQSDSPASRANLRAGDVIVAVGGAEISWDTLVPPLFESEGSSLTITRSRAGQSDEIVLTKTADPSP